MPKIIFTFFVTLIITLGLMTPVSAAPNFLRIKLVITDSQSASRMTRIAFSEGSGYTTGLNPGYDAGAFGGDPPGLGFQDRFGDNLALYSMLVVDDLGQELGFTIQSLPFDELDNLEVALGVNPSSDNIITFTASFEDMAGNPTIFPLNHRLILEDTSLGTFTELQDVGQQYSVSITTNEPELGRFFLHTTSDTIPPQGNGVLIAPIAKISNPKTDLIASCGTDAKNGSVQVSTSPEKGFSNQYDTPIELDQNGVFTISNPNWKEGTFQLSLSCTDKVGNGPSIQNIIETITFEKAKKKSKSSKKYVCKDKEATNYNRFGAHKSSKCIYELDKNIEPSSPSSSNIFKEELCPSNLQITDYLKFGDRNGVYSSYNKRVISEISLLQTHINRILTEDNYVIKPLGNSFHYQTKLGVEKTQKKLNHIFKGKISPLIIDGIVGPKTKAAINMSC